MLRLCRVNLQTRNLFTNVKNSFKKSNNSESNNVKQKNRATVHYFTGIGLLTFGLAYAAVPLYRIFCGVSTRLNSILILINN